MPKRIQRKRTKGWKMPPNTVYVGRPSMFQNPYKLHDFTSRDAPIAMFRKMALLPEGGFIYRERVIQHLRGKNLACWCQLCEKHKDGKPLDEICPDCDPCHVDLLGEIANSAPVEESHK